MSLIVFVPGLASIGRVCGWGPATGIGWIDAISYLPARQGAIGAMVLSLLAAALTWNMGYRWLAILFGLIAVGFGLEWQFGLIEPMTGVNIAIVVAALVVGVATMSIGERRRDQSPK